MSGICGCVSPPTHTKCMACGFDPRPVQPLETGRVVIREGLTEDDIRRIIREELERSKS